MGHCPLKVGAICQTITLILFSLFIIPYFAGCRPFEIRLSHCQIIFKSESKIMISFCLIIRRCQPLNCGVHCFHCVQSFAVGIYSIPECPLPLGCRSECSFTVVSPSVLSILLLSSCTYSVTASLKDYSHQSHS